MPRFPTTPALLTGDLCLQSALLASWADGSELSGKDPEQNQPAHWELFCARISLGGEAQVPGCTEAALAPRVGDTGSELGSGLPV